MTKEEAYKSISGLSDFARRLLFFRLAEANEDNGIEMVDKLMDATVDILHSSFGNYEEALKMIEEWSKEK